MFGIFKLARKVETLEKDKERLKEEKEQLETDLSKIKSQKKIEEEEIKHLIKLKESKLDVEFKRKEMDLEKAHQEKLNALQSQYNKDVQERLEKEVDRMKGMYGEVLKRLPDVNVRLKGDV